MVIPKAAVAKGLGFITFSPDFAFAKILALTYYLQIWAMVILILLSTGYNITTPTSPCLQLFQQHHQNIVKLIETGTYEVAEAIRT